MKKIIAIVLALATVFTFSATAFAAPSGRINKAQAKQIALDHAGFTENEVRFTKAKLDFDDGIFEYDIEFFVGRVEYDYTIAAADGRIIEFDIDGKEPAAPTDIITKDEAKAIALGDAALPRAKHASPRSSLITTTAHMNMKLNSPQTTPSMTTPWRLPTAG